ncbi:MAG: hypothetical protein PF495_01090 [Spirochaetales bacterium]|jgi:hypothetical protein|nr:hypothetical protein [Spirochaetales bacterium]
MHFELLSDHLHLIPKIDPLLLEEWGSLLPWAYFSDIEVLFVELTGTKNDTFTRYNA